MERCKTCKHWKNPYVFVAGLPEWGDCVRLNECHHLVGHCSDGPDANMYATREDFGCIFHEEK